MLGFKLFEASSKITGNSFIFLIKAISVGFNLGISYLVDFLLFDFLKILDALA